MIRGERTVSFEASDFQSGVARVEMLVDSRAVASQNLVSSRCRYESWNACEETASGDLVVDTRQVPDGTYTAQLRVTDAAGNQKTVQAEQPVVIANGAAAGPPTARLEARFAGRKRTTIVKNWAASAVVSGKLTSLAGAPLGGAEVKVSEIVGGGGKGGQATVRTRANGRFTYRVAPRRSSRRIRFQYLAPGSAPVAKDVRVQVRSASSFRASLRGVTLTYSGQVKSKPLPARGKLVYIQGRAKGASWQTFATRRASRRSGTFSGRYRLRVRRPGVYLQFRAVLPAEAGYPYEASTGAVVTKRVR